MGIGEVYKEIRKNKGVTQKEICQDEVTTVTLSKFENDKETPNYRLMKYFLYQVNMSFDEFDFLCNLEEPNQSIQLKNEFKKILSSINTDKIELLLQKCETYLNQKSDKSIEILKKRLLINLEIQKHGFNEKSKNLALEIWKTIDDRGEWYISDLKLLNQILFYFPAETIFDITDRILERLKEYRNYEDLRFLRAALLINLSYVYIDSFNFEKAHEILLMADKASKKLKRYDYIAICQVRLGIIEKDKNMINKGFAIFEIMEETEFKKEFEKEVEQFYPDGL